MARRPYYVADYLKEHEGYGRRYLVVASGARRARKIAGDKYPGWKLMSIRRVVG